MIKLPMHLTQTCVGHYRGWPWVLRGLEPLITVDGILLDDFVERSFQNRLHCWREPWIGIMHHPPNMPSWYDYRGIDWLMGNRRFVSSLKSCRGLICLSEYLSRAWRAVVDIPVHTILHPLDLDVPQWVGWSGVLSQVGWFLKDTQAIYTVPYKAKMRLLGTQHWVREADIKCALCLEHNKEPYEVLELGLVDVRTYEWLLCTVCLYARYLDLSASNVILDAISHSCPMILNRSAAAEEYLGAEYPGFNGRVSSADVYAAHEYLCEMDKSKLTIEHFKSNLVAIIEEVQ